MLRTGKRIKNRGFLLIELMVSVSILSIGGVLVLNSFMKPLKLAGLSQDYFKAGLLVEEKMFELSHSAFENQAQEGLFSDFGREFSWKIEHTKIEDSLYEIQLSVFWPWYNKVEDLRVSSYLFSVSQNKDAFFRPASCLDIAPVG